MPMMPTKTPGTIMFHTMVMTIPRPRMSALATPTSTVATVLPLSAMGPSPSIFLRTRTITSKMAHPTAPTATPGAKAPHSVMRHMHMPSPNTRPPTVPSTSETKFFFSMVIPPEGLTQLVFALRETRYGNAGGRTIINIPFRVGIMRDDE